MTDARAGDDEAQRERAPREPSLALLAVNLALGLLSVVCVLAFFTYDLLVRDGGRLQGDATASSLLMRVGLVWVALTTMAIALRYLLLLASAFASYLERRQADRASLPAATRRWPRVTICVPAFNEEETIEWALDGLTQLDYADYEVILVDDGSTDRTLERAAPFAQAADGANTAPRVRILSKVNGGKASALNLAIAHATGELVLTVDADSRLEPEALTRLVGRMDEPGVVAAAGQVRVRNRGNLLTQLQALEYVVGNGIVRQAQAYFRQVLVVPGPIALFRKDALDALAYDLSGGTSSGSSPAGPVEHDTLAEDCDLTLALLLRGGHVVYEPRAVAHTRAPSQTHMLLNQRYRWTRGVMQAARKQLRAWRRAPRRSVEFALWVAVMLVEMVGWSIAELSGMAAVLTVLLTGGLDQPFITMLALLTAIDLNAAVFGIAVERDDMTLAPLVVLQRFYYGPLLAIGKVFALIDELRGRRAGWS